MRVLNLSDKSEILIVVKNSDGSRSDLYFDNREECVQYAKQIMNNLYGKNGIVADLPQILLVRWGNVGIFNALIHDSISWMDIRKFFK